MQFYFNKHIPEGQFSLKTQGLDKNLNKHGCLNHFMIKYIYCKMFSLQSTFNQ